MKNLVFSFLIIISTGACAQKITELPSATGQGIGGFIPIVQGGITKRINVDSLSATAKRYADSLKAVLVIASNANAGNIATNTTNIAANTTNIATNATNIAANTTNIAANTSGLSAKANIASLATINGVSINNGGANIVISSSGVAKALYRVLTPVSPNVTWNYDTSSTVHVTTAGTLNLVIAGTVPNGSAGIIVVTQSASGGDSLKYLGTSLNIGKTANKKSLVGFIKLETGYSFSIDTISLFIASAVTPPPVGNYDVSAQALFTAAGTTGNNYKTAVDNAIKGLKAITLASGGTAWSKSLMINGRAGSTLAEQAVNWKTPGTYNYVYNGGIVYNANGTKFNGVNSYIDMSFVPITAFTGTTSDIAIVSVIGQNTNVTTTQYIYGSTGNAGGGGNIYAYINGAGGVDFSTMLSDAALSVTTGSVIGRYISTFNSATNVALYKNGGLLVQANNGVAPTFGNGSIVEGGVKFGVDIVGFTEARVDVTQIINSRLTSAEAAAIDAVWAAYETALAR